MLKSSISSKSSNKSAVSYKSRVPLAVRSAKGETSKSYVRKDRFFKESFGEDKENQKVSY